MPNKLLKKNVIQNGINNFILVKAIKTLLSKILKTPLKYEDTIIL